MIEPRKDERFQSVFFPYVRHLLKKQFYRVYATSHAPLEKGRPTLLLVNHSSWWDGLVCFYLTKTFVEYDSYAMMSQQGMTDFPFFKKIGAFSVNPSSPKHVLRSLRFAKKLLEGNRAVWIFPQGKEEHLEKRPLSFAPGASYLACEVPGIQVIPVAFYYTFRHDQRPELFISFGEALEGELVYGESRQNITHRLEQALTAQLDDVKQSVIQDQTDGYTIELRGYRTISEWFTWWKGRLAK
jgi:1-acyl-sn-glycerol-3-phosphate acyltransferase